jgi:arylsulfatase A-like enzyme
VYINEGYAKDVGSAATKRVDYSHDLFTKEALQFIERSKNQSFFLYLAYTIPHANNESHLVDRHGMEVPDYGIYKDKDWPEAQKGHAAMISRMDRDIGRLFDKLRGLGLDENTIVFFSSDNGPHTEGGAKPEFFDSNGVLRGIKRDLYEGGIRMPMIVRWPGIIEAGSVSDRISAFWDFLPTAAELGGIKPPDNIDGISMLPTLLGEPHRQKKHKFLYWEFHEQGKKQAVRMGDYKGVRLNVSRDPSGPIELYNLKTDMAEKCNVALKKPKIVAKIEKYLKTARIQSEDFPLPKSG